MSFKGQSSGAAAAPQTKFKRGDLFDLVQEVAAEGGPRWSELLADNHLVEATRDIDGISRHGLYLAAPHKEDSGLRRAEYSALYRHYVLTPSGKPWTTCPLPLLEFPFTAAEFMRFNSLLVDDLRALLTTIRTVEGEDGNRFLDEQINHELVADLPDGAGELARILLSGDTAPSVSAPAASLAEPVRFADLPRVMAEAMHTDPMARAGARINLEAELVEMVASGRLKVRDSLTHGPHTHPVGDALKSAVLLPQEVRQLLAERGVSLPAVAHPMTTERQAVSSSPPVPPYSHAVRDLEALEQAIAALAAPSFEAIPEPVAAHAESVPVLGADRQPTVQQAISPYLAKLMQERPDYIADTLYQRMRRDAGGVDSPFSRLTKGGELFCVELGKSCGIATVRAALTAYRKRQRSTVEVPSNP